MREEREVREVTLADKNALRVTLGEQRERERERERGPRSLRETRHCE